MAVAPLNDTFLIWPTKITSVSVIANGAVVVVDEDEELVDVELDVELDVVEFVELVLEELVLVDVVLAVELVVEAVLVELAVELVVDAVLLVELDVVEIVVEVVVPEISSLPQEPRLSLMQYRVALIQAAERATFDIRISSIQPSICEA